jgi:glycosyltransferase involved in cell wall biosynthesis
MLNVNKNFGFGKAKNEWILSLDSDEELPTGLADEIRAVIQQNRNTVGYWIPRKNIIFGKWIRHGLWWPDKQLRLFRKGRGKFPCVHVHEYINVDGPTDDLTIAFVHHNYNTISQFLGKMEPIYTESEVQKLIDTNYIPTWQDALRFPISDFVKIYFAQEGYKDGLHGLVLAMLQAFSSFVVFAKLWERQGFAATEVPLTGVRSEFGHEKRIIDYWLLSARIKQSRSKLVKIWLKVWRRYAATV